jgi:hypothetical protein
MIAGRSVTLWAGAATAILNAFVVVGILPLSGEQVAAVNAAVLAILAIIASSDQLAVAKGRAAADRISGVKTTTS